MTKEIKDFQMNEEDFDRLKVEVQVLVELVTMMANELTPAQRDRIRLAQQASTMTQDKAEKLLREKLSNVGDRVRDRLLEERSIRIKRTLA
ncbi:hypothetical protein U8P80_16250 [Rhizobium beringeri]|jgi:hypothetical protein|nr:hypothetical protein U8P80_16250 [Rhizobium beringeri]WSH13282.1 hypothetical protein U8P74_16250 [Rhizobium beringeri]